MRAYIGPYNHWFQPAHWLERWVLWAYGFNYRVDWDEIVAKRPNALAEIDAIKKRLHAHWFYERLQAIENWVDNKYERKINVRVDCYDTWSADNTLGLIILPTLKLLKEKKHGHAIVDDKDVPEELRSTSAPPLTQEQIDSGWLDINSAPRWEWVLSEIIWAFEQLVNDDSDDQFFTHYAEPESPGSIFNKCEMDQEGYAKWQARKQNGLLLFGKYYEALWD
jgi:hypothetical protein